MVSSYIPQRREQYLGSLGGVCWVLLTPLPRLDDTGSLGLPALAPPLPVAFGRCEGSHSEGG